MITSYLNTYYFIPTTITTINQGLNSFKCMIKGASLTSLYRWHSTGDPKQHVIRYLSIAKMKGLDEKQTL